MIPITDAYFQTKILSMEQIELLSNVQQHQQQQQQPDFTCKKEICDGDVCGICINELNEKETLLQCPTCNNIVHRECIRVWFEYVRQNTCIYCRSDAFCDMRL
jgi:hypothetical protein